MDVKVDSLKCVSKLDKYNIGDVLLDKNNRKYMFIGYNKSILWRLDNLKYRLEEQYSLSALSQNELTPGTMSAYLEIFEENFLDDYLYYSCKNYRQFYEITDDKICYLSKHYGQDKLDSVVDHKEFSFTKAMLVENSYNRDILFSDSQKILSLEDIKKYVKDIGLKELYKKIVKKKDYFLKYYDSYIFHSLRECDIEEANIVYYRGVYLCVTYMPENDEFIVTNSAKNLVVLYANCFDTYYAHTISLSKLKSAKFYKLCVY